MTSKQPLSQPFATVKELTIPEIIVLAVDNENVETAHASNHGYY